MEEREKIYIRLKLAAALRKIISKNKAIVKKNAALGVKNITVIDGIRQLEASSRLSYTIIQGVLSAKRDLHFTSLMSIIEEGLEITFTDFSKIYDSITDEEIKFTKKEIANAKRTPKKTIKK